MNELTHKVSCVYIVLKKMEVDVKTDIKILGTDKYHYSHRCINQFIGAFNNKEDAIMCALRVKDSFVETVLL